MLFFTLFACLNLRITPNTIRGDDKYSLSMMTNKILDKSYDDYMSLVNKATIVAKGDYLEEFSSYTQRHK